MHWTAYGWLFQREIEELMNIIKRKRQEISDLQRAIHASDASIHDAQRPFNQSLDRILRQQADAKAQREKELARKVHLA